MNWITIIESLLYVAGDEGLTVDQLKSVIELDDHQITEYLQALKDQLENGQRGIVLMKMKDRYKLATALIAAPYLEKFVEEPVNYQLSQAALETVAIIAYKQPVSRAGIEDIRGVKSEKALQTLINRGLVEEVGRNEGTGRAILYGITNMFYHFFGLASLDELPAVELKSAESLEDEESDLFYEKFQQTLSDLS